jgi:GTP-binding protein
MPLKVAIVGRPNVGKSTLFNRLAGRRLAIVNDRPGVTRDRRDAQGRLGDLDLELVDTAGFEDVDDASLEARMRAQTERAIEEADVCLFVIDGREGVTPLDRIFADLVRRRNKPVVLIANKAEGRAADVGAAEAFGLGLGEALPLSAEHGEGLAELYAALSGQADALGDAEAAALAGFDGHAEDEDPVGRPIRIAIVGRPNAGKSTLVNRLLGEERLLTGPEAGITRDSIAVDFAYEGRAMRLVDTAGLRRRARVQDTLEKLSTSDTIRAITFAEVVILVMDAENAFETQDLQIADLVEREGRALVFCLAKWDLVAEPQARLEALKEEADRVLPQLRGSPLVPLSAETGWGMSRLMPATLAAHAHWDTKVKTRDLNDWLAMAVQRHPPPAVNGRRIKPKYMAQVKARPPTFVLFASRADQLPDHYRRYLVHSLRESFDLPGVPIRLTVKSNRNPFVEGEAPKDRAGGRKEADRRAAPAEPGPSIPAASQPTARAPETPAPRAPRKPRPAVLKGTKGPKAMAKKAKIASRAARGPIRPKTSRPKSKGR